MKGLLLFFILVTTIHASTGILLPADSVRDQQSVTCWATNAAIMLESRIQFRENKFVMLNDISRSHSGAMLDRLMDFYKTGIIPSSDPATQMGWTAEFFLLLKNHGVLVEASDFRRMPLVSYDYPTPVTTVHRRLGPQFEGPSKSINFVSKSPKGMSASTAEKYFVEYLKLDFPFLTHKEESTILWGERVLIKNLYSKLMGKDFKAAEDTEHPFILVSTRTDGWFDYKDKRFLGYGFKNNTSKVLEVARLSIDKGWPTTFETSSHIMTFLGYRIVGDERFYAVGNSSVNWYSEKQVFEWLLEITVFQPVVQKLIPRSQLSNKANTLRSIYIAPKR